MLAQPNKQIDSTSLLIVKDEIKNIIKHIEDCTNQLIEEEVLTFGIEDALTDLNQATQVLDLIEHPYLAQLCKLIEGMMRKILADFESKSLSIADVQLMSEGMYILLSYIDYFCIKEFPALQLLIPTINRLEIALRLPLTREGVLVENLFNPEQFNLELDAPTALPISPMALQLYKHTLLKLLQNKMSEHDYHALAICGLHFANKAEALPTAQFWRLVQRIFSQAEQIYLTEPRLRTFILIEALAQQLYSTDHPTPITVQDLADVITLGLAQSNDICKLLRQQLHISKDFPADSHIQITHRQLFGLDLETIQVVCNLLNEQIADIIEQITLGDYQHDPAILVLISQQLKEMSNVFLVLNLTEAASILKQQARETKTANYHNDLSNAEKLLDTLRFASNSLQFLQYQFSPLRSKLALNNDRIDLDTVYNAQKTLCVETRLDIQQLTLHLENYIENQQLSELAEFPDRLREISGALHFLESDTGYEMLQKMARLIENSILHNQRHLAHQELLLLANGIASVDFEVERILYHQPRLSLSLEIGYASLLELERAVI